MTIKHKSEPYQVAFCYKHKHHNHADIYELIYTNRNTFQKVGETLSFILKDNLLEKLVLNCRLID